MSSGPGLDDDPASSVSDVNITRAPEATCDVTIGYLSSSKFDNPVTIGAPSISPITTSEPTAIPITVVDMSAPNGTPGTQMNGGLQRSGSSASQLAEALAQTRELSRLLSDTTSAVLSDRKSPDASDDAPQVSRVAAALAQTRALERLLAEASSVLGIEEKKPEDEAEKKPDEPATSSAPAQQSTTNISETPFGSISMEMIVPRATPITDSGLDNNSINTSQNISVDLFEPTVTSTLSLYSPTGALGANLDPSLGYSNASTPSTLPESTRSSITEVSDTYDSLVSDNIVDITDRRDVDVAGLRQIVAAALSPDNLEPDTTVNEKPRYAEADSTTNGDPTRTVSSSTNSQLTAVTKAEADSTTDSPEVNAEPPSFVLLTSADAAKIADSATKHDDPSKPSDAVSSTEKKEDVPQAPADTTSTSVQFLGSSTILEVQSHINDAQPGPLTAEDAHHEHQDNKAAEAPEKPPETPHEVPAVTPFSGEAHVASSEAQAEAAQNRKPSLTDDLSYRRESIIAENLTSHDTHYFNNKPAFEVIESPAPAENSEKKPRDSDSSKPLDSAAEAKSVADDALKPAEGQSFLEKPADGSTDNKPTSSDDVKPAEGQDKPSGSTEEIKPSSDTKLDEKPSDVPQTPLDTTSTTIQYLGSSTVLEVQSHLNDAQPGPMTAEDAHHEHQDNKAAENPEKPTEVPQEPMTPVPFSGESHVASSEAQAEAAQNRKPSLTEDPSYRRESIIADDLTSHEIRFFHSTPAFEVIEEPSDDANKKDESNTEKKSDDQVEKKADEATEKKFDEVSEKKSDEVFEKKPEQALESKPGEPADKKPEDVSEKKPEDAMDKKADDAKDQAPEKEPVEGSDKKSDIGSVDSSKPSDIVVTNETHYSVVANGTKLDKENVEVTQVPAVAEPPKDVVGQITGSISMEPLVFGVHRPYENTSSGSAPEQSKDLQPSAGTTSQESPKDSTNTQPSDVPQTSCETTSGKVEFLGSSTIIGVESHLNDAQPGPMSAEDAHLAELENKANEAKEKTSSVPPSEPEKAPFSGEAHVASSSTQAEAAKDRKPSLTETDPSYRRDSVIADKLTSHDTQYFGGAKTFEAVEESPIDSIRETVDKHNENVPGSGDSLRSSDVTSMPLQSDATLLPSEKNPLAGAYDPNAANNDYFFDKTPQIMESSLTSVSSLSTIGSMGSSFECPDSPIRPQLEEMVFERISKSPSVSLIQKPEEPKDDKPVVDLPVIPEAAKPDAERSIAEDSKRTDDEEHSLHVITTIEVTKPEPTEAEKLAANVIADSLAASAMTDSFSEKNIIDITAKVGEAAKESTKPSETVTPVMKDEPEIKLGETGQKSDNSSAIPVVPSEGSASADKPNVSSEELKIDEKKPDDNKTLTEAESTDAQKPSDSSSVKVDMDSTKPSAADNFQPVSGIAADATSSSVPEEKKTVDLTDIKKAEDNVASTNDSQEAPQTPKTPKVPPTPGEDSNMWIPEPAPSNETSRPESTEPIIDIRSKAPSPEQVRVSSSSLPPQDKSAEPSVSPAPPVDSTSSQADNVQQPKIEISRPASEERKVDEQGAKPDVSSQSSASAEQTAPSTSEQAAVLSTAEQVTPSTTEQAAPSTDSSAPPPADQEVFTYPKETHWISEKERLAAAAAAASTPTDTTSEPPKEDKEPSKDEKPVDVAPQTETSKVSEEPKPSDATTTSEVSSKPVDSVVEKPVETDALAAAAASASVVEQLKEESKPSESVSDATVAKPPESTEPVKVEEPPKEVEKPAEISSDVPKPAESVSEPPKSSDASSVPEPVKPSNEENVSAQESKSKEESVSAQESKAPTSEATSESTVPVAVPSVDPPVSTTEPTITTSASDTQQPTESTQKPAEPEVKVSEPAVSIPEPSVTKPDEPETKPVEPIVIPPAEFAPATPADQPKEPQTPKTPGVPPTPSEDSAMWITEPSSAEPPKATSDQANERSSTTTDMAALPPPGSSSIQSPSQQTLPSSSPEVQQVAGAEKVVPEVPSSSATTSTTPSATPSNTQPEPTKVEPIVLPSSTQVSTKSSVPPTPGEDSAMWITETPQQDPYHPTSPKAPPVEDSTTWITEPAQTSEKLPETPKCPGTPKADEDGIVWITEDDEPAKNRPVLERNESRDSASEAPTIMLAPPKASLPDDLASGVMEESKGAKRRLSWADQQPGTKKSLEDQTDFDLDQYERALNETTSQTRELVQLLCDASQNLSDKSRDAVNRLSQQAQSEMARILDSDGKENGVVAVPENISSEPPPQLPSGSLPSNVESVIISDPSLRFVTGSIVLPSGKLLVTDQDAGLFLFNLEGQVLKKVTNPNWKNPQSPVHFKNYVLVLMQVKDEENQWCRHIVKLTEELEFIAMVEGPKWVKDSHICSERLSVSHSENIYLCLNGELFSALYELTVDGKWTELCYKQSESFVDMLAFAVIGPITQLLVVEGRRSFVCLASIRESELVDWKRMALCERPGALAKDEAGRLFVLNRAMAAIQLVDTVSWACCKNITLVDSLVPHFAATWGLLAVPIKGAVRVHKYNFRASDLY